MSDSLNAGLPARRHTSARRSGVDETCKLLTNDNYYSNAITSMTQFCCNLRCRSKTFSTCITQVVDSLATSVDVYTATKQKY